MRHLVLQNMQVEYNNQIVKRKKQAEREKKYTQVT